LSRILIFGNSGSGKSTLAEKLVASQSLSHLDLDTLAWQPVSPPQRKSLSESEIEMLDFIDRHTQWVIEGCYSDLLERVSCYADEMIFMNLPVEACIANARSRPWESHKYESPEAQDANLSMLIEWIAGYPSRTDTFSKSSHMKLYESYTGKKTMLTANEQ
jgi:adenylate kinase family enzyme